MPKTKKKKTTLDYLTSVVLDHSGKIEELVGIVNELVRNAPSFSGGTTVRVTLANGGEQNFYMVSDMFINEPFIEFFHLVPADPDNRDFSIKSFPEKSPNQGMRAFISRLGKQSRWNRVHEQFNLTDVARVQTFGFYTYSRFVSSEENKQNTPISSGEVIDLSKRQK